MTNLFNFSGLFANRIFISTYSDARTI